MKGAQLVDDLNLRPYEQPPVLVLASGNSDNPSERTLLFELSLPCAAVGACPCPTRAELRASILPHIGFPYTATSTDVWDILRAADAARECTPDGCAAFAANVTLIWSRLPFAAAAQDSGRGGDVWNREHMFPKSLGGFGTACPEGGSWSSPPSTECKDGGWPGTDIHALRPAHRTCNTYHLNYKYGVVDASVQPPTIHGGASCDIRCDGGFCEPPDVAKGEVARAMFYMDVRYDGAGDWGRGLPHDWDDLKVNDVAQSVELLLGWHEAFPPTEAERAREAVAYSYQGNHNPFVVGNASLARCVFSQPLATQPPPPAMPPPPPATLMPAPPPPPSLAALGPASGEKTWCEQRHNSCPGLVAVSLVLFGLVAFALLSAGRCKCKKGRRTAKPMLEATPQVALQLGVAV